MRCAHALSAGDAGITAELAEALVFAAEGMATPEAERLFADAQRADPAIAAAPFYSISASAMPSGASRMRRWRSGVRSLNGHRRRRRGARSSTT